MDQFVLQATLDIISTCLPGPLASAVTSPSSDSDSGRGGGDRISALPDDVRRIIISFLPLKDGARTAALSSCWRRLWGSIPLVLHDADLASDARIVPISGRATTTTIADRVSRILAHHPGPFRFVRLQRNSMKYGDYALAEEWLRLLAAKHVQDLVFINRPWPRDALLPESILRSASLRRLYLGVWRFPDTAGRRRGVAFPELRELGLCRTIINQRDIEYLIACSPVLETFAVIASFGNPPRVSVGSRSLRCVLLWGCVVEELHIVAVRSLERLILVMTGDDVKIKIGNAPKLAVLGYLITSSLVLQIGNTTIDDGATHFGSSVPVPSVKVLALVVRFGVPKDVRILLRFLRCFPNVETLHLKIGDFAIHFLLKYKSDATKMAKCYVTLVAELRSPTPLLQFDHWTRNSYDQGELTSEFWEDVIPIRCVRSGIKKVVFESFKGVANEFGFLGYILDKARVLEKVVVVLDAARADETIAELGSLASTKISIVSGRAHPFSYSRASDLSVDDPFLGE